MTIVGLLLNIFVACPQCLCPRGVTAIRLAVKIIKQKSSSPVMSNALVARPPFGLLSK
jgi:hypothetical protein